MREFIGKDGVVLVGRVRAVLSINWREMFRRPRVTSKFLMAVVCLPDEI